MAIEKMLFKNRTAGVGNRWALAAQPMVYAPHPTDVVRARVHGSPRIDELHSKRTTFVPPKCMKCIELNTNHGHECPQLDQIQSAAKPAFVLLNRLAQSHNDTVWKHFHFRR